MTKTTDSVAPANAATLALLTEYHDAKRVEDEAKAKVETLRSRVIDALNGADVDQFTSPEGDVIVSRVHFVRETLDKDIVAKFAKATYARALKRTEGERINIPRLKRK